MLLVKRENELMQKWIAKSLNTSVSTINTIINNYLHLKKAKKYIVAKLLLRHVTPCRSFHRALYEKIFRRKWLEIHCNPWWRRFNKVHTQGSDIMHMITSVFYREIQKNSEQCRILLQVHFQFHYAFVFIIY